MQREILFRGKRKDTGKWIYGIPTTYFGEDYICIPTDYESNHTYDSFPHREMISYAVIPESIGQYTGIKDSEDNRIFEGDILDFAEFDYNGIDTHYKGIVKYVNGIYEIWNEPKNEYYGCDGAFILGYIHAQDDEIRVVGNWLDN